MYSKSSLIKSLYKSCYCLLEIWTSLLLTSVWGFTCTSSGSTSSSRNMFVPEHIEHINNLGFSTVTIYFVKHYSQREEEDSTVLNFAE